MARIVIETQESGKRIIDKTGPLANPADRDHCIQYMTAVGLLEGRSDGGRLRGRSSVPIRTFGPTSARPWKSLRTPTSRATTSTLSKRSIGNAVQVFFNDGSATERVAIEYPIGHRRRRAEGVPILIEKFERNLRTRLSARQSENIATLCADACPVGRDAGSTVSWTGSWCEGRRDGHCAPADFAAYKGGLDPAEHRPAPDDPAVRRTDHDVLRCTLGGCSWARPYSVVLALLTAVRWLGKPAAVSAEQFVPDSRRGRRDRDAHAPPGSARPGPRRYPMKIARALISLSDKTGLLPFARALAEEFRRRTPLHRRHGEAPA